MTGTALPILMQTVDQSPSAVTGKLFARAEFYEVGKKPGTELAKIFDPGQI
jgi:hypothetical protein